MHSVYRYSRTRRLRHFRLRNRRVEVLCPLFYRLRKLDSHLAPRTYKLLTYVSTGKTGDQFSGLLTAYRAVCQDVIDLLVNLRNDSKLLQIVNLHAFPFVSPNTKTP